MDDIVIEDWRPNFLFGLDPVFGQELKNVYAFHTDKGSIPVGAVDNEVLGVAFDIAGKNEDPWLHLKSISFDGKSSISYAAQQVASVALYYTGTDSTFSRVNKVGSPPTLPLSKQIDVSQSSDLDNIVFNLQDAANPNGLRLSVGKNFFWLAYTLINNDVIVGRRVDARLSGYELRYVDYDAND
jgi:hypothetical protein